MIVKCGESRHQMSFDILPLKDVDYFSAGGCKD